jgi:hypothetical protein
MLQSCVGSTTARMKILLAMLEDMSSNLAMAFEDMLGNLVVAVA